MQLCVCSMFYSLPSPSLALVFFFFNDTATTEIYTLSLHDALPIWRRGIDEARSPPLADVAVQGELRHDEQRAAHLGQRRSEEHTSELQSRLHLVCRLLLEKKKQTSGYPVHVLPLHPTASEYRPYAT